MAAKGYTAVADVEAFLGLSFTGAQAAQATALLERVEGFIDQYTQRGWLVGAQTDELIPYPAKVVYLRYAPVDTLTSVYERRGIGETETLLVVDDDYELEDAEAGRLRLVAPSGLDRLRVTYTPVDTVPAAIKQAAVELVAHWLRSTLQPGAYGVQSFSIPDLTVSYRQYAAEAVPISVTTLLDHYRWLQVA